MAVLVIDTVALQSSAAAAGSAQDSLRCLRQEAVGRAAAAAGMSGWETEAMAWGAAYDDAAANIVIALHGLEAAYASAAFHTRAAASLYAFTEQVAGGAPMPYEVPPEPAARQGLPPLPVSAVGGRFPITPDFGQVVADVAGRAWPSGDAEAMRSAAEAWTTAGSETEAAAGRHFAAAVSPLAGLQSADIALLREHHRQLRQAGLEVAEACRALAGDCTRMAELVEETHSQLTSEIESFVRDVVVSVGVSVLVSVLSAGIGALLSQAAAAGRLMRAAHMFQVITDRFAADAALAQHLLRSAGSLLAGSLPKALRFSPWPLGTGQPAIRLGRFGPPTLAARALKPANEAGDYALSFAASGPAGLAAHGLTKIAKSRLQHVVDSAANAGPGSFRRRLVDNLDFGSKFSIVAVGGHRLYGRMQDAKDTASPEGFLRATMTPRTPPVTKAAITLPPRLRTKLGTTPQPARQDAAERGFLATHPKAASSPSHRKGGSAGSR